MKRRAATFSRLPLDGFSHLKDCDELIKSAHGGKALSLA
jgi:hypothetical protein